MPSQESSTVPSSYGQPFAQPESQLNVEKIVNQASADLGEDMQFNTSYY
jgi:hypothetical protein